MKSRRGFTLIELLVVVAIIALLIAILLPALGRAKKKARSAQCLSNCRSMGDAMHLYIADWQAMFPYSADTLHSWTQLLMNAGQKAGVGQAYAGGGGYGGIDKM